MTRKSKKTCKINIHIEYCEDVNIPLTEPIKSLNIAFHKDSLCDDNKNKATIETLLKAIEHELGVLFNKLKKRRDGVPVKRGLLIDNSLGRFLHIDRRKKERRVNDT